MAADGVGCKKDAGYVGQDHALDNHRKQNVAVLKIVLAAIENGAIGEERDPTGAHTLQQMLLAAHIKEGVLLPCKRSVG